MPSFEITFPVIGTARVAIEAESEAEAIAKAVSGEGCIELNEWTINATKENAEVVEVGEGNA